MCYNSAQRTKKNTQNRFITKWDLLSLQNQLPVCTAMLNKPENPMCTTLTQTLQRPVVGAERRYWQAIAVF